MSMTPEEKRAKAAKQMRDWRAKNPEKAETARIRDNAARHTPEARKKAAEQMARWRANNREHHAEYMAKRRARPEERLKAAARTAQWRLDNPDKVKESNARWREWFDADRSRINRARYRARLADATIEVFTEDEVLTRHGKTCYLCLEPIDLSIPRTEAFGLHLDHVVPLFRGGAHSLDNVHPAHAVCNLRKNDSAWLGPFWWGYLN